MQDSSVTLTRIGMLVFGLIFGLLSLITVEYLQSIYGRDYLTEERRLLTQQLALIRANIEAKVNADIMLADNLATMLSFNPNAGKETWQQMVTHLALKGEHIRSISIAPNDVIAFIYPLEGNEAAMGLDFRERPDQFSVVSNARYWRRLELDGPVNLVQGGVGLIARAPVFFDPPHNQQYWGVCSVVIDLDLLIEHLGAKELPEGLSLAVRRMVSADVPAAVFVGSAEDFADPSAKELVYLQGGLWQLALVDKRHSSVFSPDHRVRIVGYSMALLILMSFLLVVNAYRMAHKVSLHDSLTGLPNRRFVLSLLERLASANNSCFTVVNVDLNDFKQINDQYGHGIGDQALRHVASAMCSALRGSDMVSRIGGDEFLLVLPRLSGAAEIAAVLEKLRREVNARPMTVEGQTVPLALSMGVACYPEDGRDISTLLLAADKAMYADKAKTKQERECAV
ncbi:sensor domain-containing diguanylate cyclase [Shewanella sp. JM162201]|uniref:Sensor domain-containing diguanylate cyclase n=1 Tax=Shewanella jiangmenensis TaxID=2837387 RepID=A0ABS5V628_9GAMM|nr:diguanylate cyclase [Shewanella jiangmenensis]MBT1445277.1 sensor domain-containing diguanylate cyclase [Shewanella jiangmenensis]